MKEVTILYPVLAHIVLVLGLYILLGLRKAAAVKSKSVNLKEAALNNQAWPSNVIQVSNNIANQFESPILFYVLCVITLLTESVNILAISLACIYVFLRYLHSFFHTGSNFVPHRFRVFALSLLVMLVLLIQTIIQIVSNA
jgi:hypothetical protein